MSKKFDSRMLTLLSSFGAGVLDLARESIAANERMHAASLQASQNLLEAALKGAENCSPEQFEVLVGALERVTVAGISAEKEVNLSSLENGKTFIKVNQALGEAAIAQAPALIEVAKIRAKADNKRADAELTNAESRKEEVGVKKTNAETEAKKEANFKRKFTNGVHADA